MINNFLFFLNIKRMSEKTLKFGKIIVNKREFNISKQPIDADQLVTSDRFKRSDDDFNISLVTKMVKLLNRYVLSYLK